MPITNAVTIIIPNPTGDNPQYSAIGKRTGVNNMIAAIPSKKVPTINSRILINTSTNIGFAWNCVRKPLIIVGSPSIVSR